MPDKQLLETMFKQHGFNDFKWIKAEVIKVAQWVRFKCLFGCPDYAKTATCPPHVPSLAACREFIADYNDAVIFHFEKNVLRPEDRKPWSKEMGERLYKLEREVFLAGYYKAFMLHFDSCNLCADCSGERAACRQLSRARPGAEALGVDVFATIRSAGYNIEVLKNYDSTMHRFAFLLVA